MSSDQPRGSLLRRAGFMLLVGLPGVIAVAAHTALATPATAIPPGLSRPLLAVSAIINSFIILVPACLLGAYAAPKVGLRSYLLDRLRTGDPVWPRLRPELRLAAILGIVGSIAIIAIDAALAPFIAVDLPQSAVTATRPTYTDVLLFVPVRFLYGGITEELLLRFGLMSTIAFVGWYVTGRRSMGPSSTIMWGAIVVSAVLFGVGHLPALAQQVGLTPLLIVRTILLNAILGVAFGWLYWRRSLEAAMAAHVAAHVPLTLLALVQVALL